MNVESTLEKLGFSKNEIKVYLTLNDYGSNKAGKISKIANIERTSCYLALQSLLQKGVVSYVMIGKVKWFQAKGPKQLLAYLQEQVEDIKSILPDLQKRHNSAKIEGQVRLFKGVKGIKSIFQDIINSGEVNYVFGSEGQLSEKLPSFTEQFNRMKKENNIKTKMIVRRGREENGGILSEYRYLNVKESPAVTNIYGDKIAIVVWTKDPEGILIENAAAAKAFKSYFDVLWNNADKK